MTKGHPHGGFSEWGRLVPVNSISAQWGRAVPTPAGRRSLLLVTALTLLACVVGAAGVPDAFTVNRSIGRGVNVGNALEAPVEGEWGVTIKEEYFDIIKAARFDSVRIAVRWSGHAGETAPFTVDPKFFQRTDEVIGQALARGLAVILTTHHYNELYQDPDWHRERFLAIWTQVARHYQDYRPALCFEPLNEPHENLDAPKWNRLIEDMLPMIRQSNPTRTVLLGPANYNDIQQLEAFELPKGDRNIIVSIHYYLPYHFTHQGAHWAPGADAWLGTEWKGLAAEKRAVERDLEVAAAWAKRNNRPICLSEFGANSKADMASRARWTRCVADTAVENKFSFTYWDFCAEFFGLYDLKTRSWHPELLDAVIPRSAPVPGAAR